MKTPLSGTISPTGDADYYGIEGLNPTWGYIVLLDTLSSTTGHQATLTALDGSGTTVLQSDTGSWERGSGIALQSYVSGSMTCYLKVNETGDDNTITPYTIRYYNTLMSTQDEVEPNDSYLTGTPSSRTMSGTISTAGDVDCFGFHGRAGDTILLAVDAASGPLGPGIDAILELLDPAGESLAKADVSGPGGQEFVEYVGLPGEGLYTYGVSSAGGHTSPVPYRVGLVRNDVLCLPGESHSIEWLNPRPAGYALVGDILSFRLAVTNTSPITISGDIDLMSVFDPEYLVPVSEDPPSTSQAADRVRWEGIKPELAPGEVYSVTAHLRALAPCQDTVVGNLMLPYYFTGLGTGAEYTVRGAVYLPLVLRSAG